MKAHGQAKESQEVFCVFASFTCCCTLRYEMLVFNLYNDKCIHENIGHVSLSSYPDIPYKSEVIRKLNLFEGNIFKVLVNPKDISRKVIDYILTHTITVMFV